VGAIPQWIGAVVASGHRASGRNLDLVPVEPNDLPHWYVAIS